MKNNDFVLSGLKIRERHNSIKTFIGVFPEEEEAYSLVTLLMWLLPMAVTVGTVLDFCLFRLYNSKFHTWSGILQDEETKKEEDEFPEEIGKMFASDPFAI